jgi:hypothetical protein
MYIYIKDGVLTKSTVYVNPNSICLDNNHYPDPNLYIQYNVLTYMLYKNDLQRISFVPDGSSINTFNINTTNPEMLSYGMELRETMKQFIEDKISIELMTEIFNHTMERMKKLLVYITEIYEQSVQSTDNINLNHQCKSAN